MIIRKALVSEIKEIKRIIDSSEEMDITDNTFTEEYYQRILRKGILLVAISENRIIGCCFGNYNKKEKWADLLGIVVNKSERNNGIGSSLVKEFENIACKKGLKTIDLFADKTRLQFFTRLNYTKGRTYIAFRKEIDVNSHIIK